MYRIKIKDNVDKKFQKISRKNPEQLNRIFQKVDEILVDPHRYKNLKAPMNKYKRVHIGHFVLTFSVDEKSKKVTLENYDHHDMIYK